MTDYDRGWNDAVDKVIEIMKDSITSRLEKHKVISSSYIIDKIAAGEVINFITEFRGLKK